MASAILPGTRLLLRRCFEIEFRRMIAYEASERSDRIHVSVVAGSS
jgi:hypothetical protein